jgi:hypothetical protein
LPDYNVTSQSSGRREQAVEALIREYPMLIITGQHPRRSGRPGKFMKELNALAPQRGSVREASDTAVDDPQSRMIASSIVSSGIRSWSGVSAALKT